MVGGPSLACENQNKPLRRPNDAIMKVVLSPSSRRAPPPLASKSTPPRTGLRLPTERFSFTVCPTGGRRGRGGCQDGKDSKAGSLVDLHLDCSLKPLTGTQECQDFPSHRYFVATAPPRKSFNGARSAEPFWFWRRWPRCSFYLVTIHQFMT